MKLFLTWWSDEIMEHPLTAVQVLNLCAPLAVVFMILIHSNLWLLLIIWWHDTKVLMTRHGQIYCSWAAYRSSQMTALLIMAARRSIISMQYKFRWSKISCSGVLRWVTNLTTFLGRPDRWLVTSNCLSNGQTIWLPFENLRHSIDSNGCFLLPTLKTIRNIGNIWIHGAFG